jgi:hypothetical protein
MLEQLAAELMALRERVAVLESRQNRRISIAYIPATHPHHTT